jgi:hypothetical protein
MMTVSKLIARLREYPGDCDVIIAPFSLTILPGTSHDVAVAGLYGSYVTLMPHPEHDPYKPRETELKPAFVGTL